MTLNLIKMAVGIADLDDLARVQKLRRKERGRYGFYTRNMPKRGDELLDGGSIYWVIKGQIRARQRLLGLHPMEDEEGKRFCVVEFDKNIVPTQPRRQRPFQGWRYLAPADAPRDRPPGAAEDDELPPAMAEELRQLGLL